MYSSFIAHVVHTCSPCESTCHVHGCTAVSHRCLLIYRCYCMHCMIECMSCRCGGPLLATYQSCYNLAVLCLHLCHMFYLELASGCHICMLLQTPGSTAEVWCSNCWQLVEQLRQQGSKQLFVSSKHSLTAQLMRKFHDRQAYRMQLKDALRLHEVQRLKALSDHVQSTTVITAPKAKISMPAIVAHYKDTVHTAATTSASSSSLSQQLPIVVAELVDFVHAVAADSKDVRRELFNQMGVTSSIFDTDRIIKTWLSVPGAYLFCNPGIDVLKDVERSMENRRLQGLNSSSSSSRPDSPAAIMADIQYSR